MRVTFAGVRFELSEEWCDITANLDPGAPPTLAREDGVGAIQFSVAKYKSGVQPAITEIALKKMLLDLFKSNQLADVEPAVLQGSRCFGVSATSAQTDEVIRAWYLSNGTDIALVTYIGTGDPTCHVELAEAEGLAKTLEFA
jgi:hypothetical protein